MLFAFFYLANKMLKICSWNVNGIRSFPKPFETQLAILQSDIVCIQETKAARDLPADYCRADGYNAYFSHCKSKPGYSGVAIFCKDPIRPTSVSSSLRDLFSEIVGLEVPCSLNDEEGRTLALNFTGKDPSIPPLTIICVYCPCVDPEKRDRVEYQNVFLTLLKTCMLALISKGRHVVVAGDFNICHRPIDICDLEEYKNFNSLPILWLDSCLISSQRIHKKEDNRESLNERFVDLFRLAHPNREHAYSCWSTRTGARKTNYGCRIDYIICNVSLVAETKTIRADLMTDIEGSDHCPVWAMIPNIDLATDGALPADCTNFWPQCQTRQLHISDFLQKRPATSFSSIAFAQPAAKHKKQKQLTLIGQKITATVPSIKQKPETEEGKAIRLALDNADKMKAERAVHQWRRFFSRGEPTPRRQEIKAPLCRGHRESCLRRRVKREGENHGREFWVCPRAPAVVGNLEGRCNTFIWLDASS